MSVTGWDFLFRVGGPVVVVSKGEPERHKWNPTYFYSHPELEVCVRRLRGNKMRATQELMNETAAALQFFGGFGENWYALEECLSYLDEWLPADCYVLIVERADELLAADHVDALEGFLVACDAAGRFWSKSVVDNDRFNREPKPFHVLLLLSDASYEKQRERILDAGRRAHVRTDEIPAP